MTYASFQKQHKKELKQKEAAFFAQNPDAADFVYQLGYEAYLNGITAPMYCTRLQSFRAKFKDSIAIIALSGKWGEGWNASLRDHYEPIS